MQFSNFKKMDAKDTGFYFCQYINLSFNFCLSIFPGPISQSVSSASVIAPVVASSGYVAPSSFAPQTFVAPPSFVSGANAEIISDTNGGWPQQTPTNQVQTDWSKTNPSWKNQPNEDSWSKAKEIPSQNNPGLSNRLQQPTLANNYVTQNSFAQGQGQSQDQSQPQPMASSVPSMMPVQSVQSNTNVQNTQLPYQHQRNPYTNITDINSLA
jgi:hypothetical protein